MKFYSDCSAVEINVNSDGVLSVGMKYTRTSSKVVAAEFKRKETDDYFNPSTGYLDLSSLGIKRVEYTQL